MTALTDLQQAVSVATTVEQSAIVLLQGLKEALDAALANGDPTALAALSDELGKATAALSEAITANTPSA